MDIVIMIISSRMALEGNRRLIIAKSFVANVTGQKRMSRTSQ